MREREKKEILRERATFSPKAQESFQEELRLRRCRRPTSPPTTATTTTTTTGVPGCSILVSSFCSSSPWVDFQYKVEQEKFRFKSWKRWSMFSFNLGQIGPMFSFKLGIHNTDKYLMLNMSQSYFESSF